MADNPAITDGVTSAWCTLKEIVDAVRIGIGKTQAVG